MNAPTPATPSVPTLAPAPAPRHTAGPWQWNGHCLRPAVPDPQHHAVHTILELDNTGSGFVGSNRAATRAELEADHRLIAAAPSMHTALVQARKALASTLALLDAALATTTAGDTP